MNRALLSTAAAAAGATGRARPRPAREPHHGDRGNHRHRSVLADRQGPRAPRATVRPEAAAHRGRPGPRARRGSSGSSGSSSASDGPARSPGTWPGTSSARSRSRSPCPRGRSPTSRSCSPPPTAGPAGSTTRPSRSWSPRPSRRSPASDRRGVRRDADQRGLRLLPELGHRQGGACDMTAARRPGRVDHVQLVMGTGVRYALRGVADAARPPSGGGARPSPGSSASTGCSAPTATTAPSAGCAATSPSPAEDVAVVEEVLGRCEAGLGADRRLVRPLGRARRASTPAPWSRAGRWSRSAGCSRRSAPASSSTPAATCSSAAAPSRGAAGRWASGTRWRPTPSPRCWRSTRRLARDRGRDVRDVRPRGPRHRPAHGRARRRPALRHRGRTRPWAGRRTGHGGVRRRASTASTASSALTGYEGFLVDHHRQTWATPGLSFAAAA